MGGSKSKEKSDETEEAEEMEEMKVKREGNAPWLAEWHQESQYNFDLSRLIGSCQTQQQWFNHVNVFLSRVRSRRKYQSCLKSIISYLEEGEDREMQDWYRRKLGSSYFTKEDFTEKDCQDRKDGLLYLYQSSQDDAYVSEAIQSNAPSILDDYNLNALVARVLIEQDIRSLARLVVQIGHKQRYVTLMKLLLNYDNCQAALAIMDRLKTWGDGDALFQMKLRVMWVMLYEKGNIKCGWDQLKSLTVMELAHFVFTHCEVEESKMLQISVMKEYLYGREAHIFTAINAILKEVIPVEQGEFKLFQRKLMECNINVMDHRDMLIRVTREKYGDQSLTKLIESADLLNYFQVDMKMGEVRDFISGTKSKQQCELIIARVLNHHGRSESHQRIRLSGAELVDLGESQGVMRVCLYLDMLFGNTLALEQVQSLIIHHFLKQKKYEWVRELKVKEELKQSAAMIYGQKMLIEKKIDSAEMTKLLQFLRMHPPEEHPNTLTYFFQYLRILENCGLYLKEEQKRNVGLHHLYCLADLGVIESADYNQLYRLIGYINHGREKGSINQELERGSISQEREICMTDEFLRFKLYLAEKCFVLHKIKAGNSFIDQIIEFQPPWLATELLSICQKTDRSDSLLNIALEYICRGADLQMLMEMYGANEAQQSFLKDTLRGAIGGTIGGAIGGARKIVKQLTHRNYIVIGRLIVNESQYRNYVAEMTFNIEQLKKEELFFVLLGTEPERAFHHALAKGVNSFHIFTCMSEGMRSGVLSTAELVPLLHKYLHFCQTSSIPSFREFQKVKSEQIYEKIAQGDETWLDVALRKCQVAMQVLSVLDSNFMQQNVRDVHGFLFDAAKREQVIGSMLEQPMSKNHIQMLLRLNPTLIETVATALNCEGDRESYLQKMVTWGQKSRQVSQEIVRKIVEKVKKLKVLNEVLQSLRERQNAFLRDIITEEHMVVLSSLVEVQIGDELSGFIDTDFFDRELGVREEGQQSQNQRELLRRVGRLSNIFVLGKAMYFMKGMREEVEKEVLRQFLSRSESVQFREIERHIMGLLGQ